MIEAIKSVVNAALDVAERRARLETEQRERLKAQIKSLRLPQFSDVK